MSRKLATIQTISDIQPIEKADKIEVATVLGWKVVIKKGEFQIGDKAIYVEIDSILPDKPEFEFLRDRKFRVKSVKFRGQISQGLLLPTSMVGNHSYKVGDDVTRIMSITKYDPELIEEQSITNDKSLLYNNPIYKYLKRYKWFRKMFIIKQKSTFPSFIKKTDEERIQNMPSMLWKEANTQFIVSEKLDGCSATYYLVKNKNKFKFYGSKYTFGVCSRNMELKTPDKSAYWNIARIYNIEYVLKQLISNHDYVILQGEIIGDKIQGNKYNISGIDFYGFNIIYPTHQEYMQSAQYSLNNYGMKHVPIINKDFRLPLEMNEMLDCAKGKSVLADVEREGIVIRDYTNKISFKVINNDFLLKHNL